MEARRAEEGDSRQWKAIRRGWCLGSAQFKAELLERIEGKLGEHHSGELKRETVQAKAERIVTEELKRKKWSDEDLVEKAKTDPQKLAIAARLRRETTLTLPCIADRLHMGSWKSLRNVVRTAFFDFLFSSSRAASSKHCPERNQFATLATKS